MAAEETEPGFRTSGADRVESQKPKQVESQSQSSGLKVWQQVCWIASDNSMVLEPKEFEGASLHSCLESICPKKFDPAIVRIRIVAK